MLVPYALQNDVRPGNHVAHVITHSATNHTRFLGESQTRHTEQKCQRLADTGR